MNFEKRMKGSADSKRAIASQRYFKTGPGQYGEGDLFLGLTVPECRKIAKEFRDMQLDDIQRHLKSKWHEERLIALLILVEKYNWNPKKIFDFYIDNLKYVNNWDLVDLTAHRISGRFLVDKDKKILYGLVKSDNLWEKRVSIISCFAFIDRGEFDDALKISKLLLGDKHDLIHKAVGWVLREIGKKDINVLKQFLREHYNQLPRTTLRYAIERFPETERKAWLKGKFC